MENNQIGEKHFSEDKKNSLMLKAFLATTINFILFCLFLFGKSYLGAIFFGLFFLFMLKNYLEIMNRIRIERGQ